MYIRCEAKVSGMCFAHICSVLLPLSPSKNSSLGDNHPGVANPEGFVGPNPPDGTTHGRRQQMVETPRQRENGGNLHRAVFDRLRNSPNRAFECNRP